MTANENITRQLADAEFSAALQVVRRYVPTHAQLTALLAATESAALSFHEHAGFDGSGSVCDGISDASTALGFCFHTSARAA